MAWKKGTATSMNDLLSQVKNFISKTTDVSSVTDITSGGMTGDGIVFGASSTESSVAENWDLKCTNIGSFSITGSASPDVTGSYTRAGLNDGKPYFTNATYAVWWDTATEYWYITIIANIGSVQTNTFRKAGYLAEGTFESVGTNTGTPVAAASVAGGSLPTFSVTGSVSGSSDTARVNEPYSNGLVSFTIVEGDTQFVIDDEFRIAIGSSSALWVIDKYDNSGTVDFVTNPSGTHEIICHGIGGGTDAIYCGLKVYTNDADYFNIRIGGFTGYSNLVDWENQPGLYDNTSYYIVTMNSTFDFYLWMSNRRILIIPIIGTSYEWAHMGWLKPNSSPSQTSYPMMIGATTTSETTQTTSSNRYGFWESNYNRILAAAYNDLGWTGISCNQGMFPYVYNITDTMIYYMTTDILGNLPLFSFMVRDYDNNINFGEIEGVYACVSDGGKLSTEDVLIREDRVFKVFQSALTGGNCKTAAVELY